MLENITKVANKSFVEPVRCGATIFGIGFYLAEDHPFANACAIHDAVYDDKKNGIIIDDSSKKYDIEWLKNALAEIPKYEGGYWSISWYILQAFFFYPFVRLRGIYKWNRQ